MTDTPTGPTRPDPAALLQAALTEARHGRAVFPCVPNEKRPLTVHGMLDATTDPDQISTWWRRHPTANIGMPTGAGSYDVLDIDIRQTGSGIPAYDRLRTAGLIHNPARIIRTPSKGLHFYFAGTDQGSSSIPAQHLDFKAQGGYVLIPPSVVHGHPYNVEHVSGTVPGPLHWAKAHELLAPAASMPDSVSSARRPNQGIEPLAAWVARLPEGQRNQGLFWAACRAVEHGERDLRPLLNAALTAGLTRTEAGRTIRSAIIHGTPAMTPSVYRTATPRPSPPRRPRP